MFLIRIFLCVSVYLALSFKLASAEEPLTLKLWPDGPPSKMNPKSEATKKLIDSYGKPGPNRISDVLEPTITIYKPAKPNGASVIVAPGVATCFFHGRMRAHKFANG